MSNAGHRRRALRLLRRGGALILALFFGSQELAAQSTGTTVKPNDAVAITVVDQPALSNTYIVGLDGALEIPVIGRVEAAGSTPEQLTAELSRRLTSYLVNPQVHVEVIAAKRVFVFGEVKVPGEYPLVEDSTLLEVLTRAGYSGTSEVLLLRPKLARGPTALGDRDAEVIRINLLQLEKEAQSGNLSRNVLLREGDSIYVSKDDPNRIYVSGQVQKPGPYSISEGTTVLQALTLAGGTTERAATSRLRITRIVAGEERSIKGELEDSLKPGDAILVPEVYSFPLPTFGRPGLETRRAHAVRIGQALSIVPSAAVTRLGVDSNVFNQSGQPVSDFTATAGPALDAILDLKLVQVTASGNVDFVYYRRFDDQRSVDRYGEARIDVKPSRRIDLWFGGDAKATKQRLNFEVDPRIPWHEQTVEAGVRVRPWQRVEFELTGRDFDQRFEDSVFLGVELRATLTERVRSATATARWILTPFTTLVASAGSATHRFELFPAKNADATEFLFGGLWKAGGVLSGEAQVGYLRYLSLDVTAPDMKGAVGNVDLFYSPKDRTRFGAKLERSTGNTFRTQFPYAIIDSLGGSVQQGLFSRLDVLVQAYRQKYTYQTFAFFGGIESPNSTETTGNYVAELGVRLGAARIGFNIGYTQRLATNLIGRDYNSIALTTNISYGALQVRGR